ncbi:hypothetical protein PanWU01x14_222820 [Parasponia andersonii]|uniref:Uncharacterized protein n=1 Tax=Parasponia andersonii TaxID=3476 RepID=A0A2P5BNN2_PARAD|nr:hypothetical protein PanWU01x14_222820 [Parasponia andersonii]
MMLSGRRRKTFVLSKFMVLVERTQSNMKGGLERRGWPPAKTLRCLSPIFTPEIDLEIVNLLVLNLRTEYLFSQDFLQRSRAEITVIPLYRCSLVFAVPYSSSLLGARFGQITILSGRLAPCAHLLKIALNALSGSGAVSHFPSYSGGRPLGLSTPSCRSKNQTGPSPSRVWDGLGPNLRQPNG